MKKYLITGGAGFIGTNLVKKLLEKHPYVPAITIFNYFEMIRGISQKWITLFSVFKMQKFCFK